MKSICSPTANQIDVPAIKWGRQHEKDAIWMYKRCMLGITEEGLFYLSSIIAFSNGMKLTHSKPVIQSAGFLLCKENPWLGASPDAYLVCGCCERCVIEVKCPFKWTNEKNTLIDMVTERPGHLDESGELEKSHKYFTQVKLQMYVTKLNACHFITWTPRDSIISLVSRDEDFIKKSVP